MAVYGTNQKRENCRLPLPVAEESSLQFPQLSHLRAVAKQARECQCGKVSKGS